MKFSFLFLFALFLLGVFDAHSQQYFQQEVNFEISVKLNDIEHEISAFETIEYINNSPDKLEFIFFHIWPNAYDNNNTALAKQKLQGAWSKLFDVEEHRGYIDSLDFKVDGRKVKWEYDQEHIDICKIYLNKPLEKGAKIIITTPFHVKLPKGVTSRLGHIDESYQITQWYPKPAVYDKFGWHQMPYLNQGEFYSEFGSYDVSITLPKNYVVGATGDLQNEKEIDWLNSLAEKTAEIEEFDYDDNDFPASSEEFKTIRYTQKNIHDFAWFADKRFNVLTGEVKLPHSGRVVKTWAMFPNIGGNLWTKSIEYINDALYYYSKWNGDYPYNQATAVLSALTAGGGMEYPNITVIGNSATDMALEMVIMHEVGHNWFYGILGFNERDFGWMDEGINSFNEQRYMHAKYGKDLGLSEYLGVPTKVLKFGDLDKVRYKDMHEMGYAFSARLNLDQHASLNAADYTEANYGMILYFKSARVMDYLMQYLGEDEFDKIMQGFFNKWKYKHPNPEDLQKCFEENTGKDLSWLFTDLIKTTKKIDYKIQAIRGDKVLIKNIGDINSPLSLSGIKKSEPVYTEWYEGFEGKKWLSLPKSTDLDMVQIDHNYDMLDLYRKNNQIRTSGLFKKIEPIRLKFFGAVENPLRTQLNAAPVMGWNSANKYMLGAIFYNSFIPAKKMEYQLMPMFAFGTKDLAGSASFAYHILPYNSIFQSIDISLSGKKYALDNVALDIFGRIKASVAFNFASSNPRSKVKDQVVIDGIMASNPEYLPGSGGEENIKVYNLKYNRTHTGPNNPYSLNINLQAGDGFVKSSVSAKYRITYQYKNGLDMRLFAGTFLYKKADVSPMYNFILSGSRGMDDYTFDEYFFNRGAAPYTGFLSHQFIPNDGAFATYAPTGQTNKWIVAMNLSSSLPIKKNIPIKGFVNIAALGESIAVPGYPDMGTFQWEAGVKLSLGNDMFEVFLPLIMSNDLKEINDQMTNSYIERVRFSIKLNGLNPFVLARSLF
ncbi:MAG: M1 family metallopeptidase [Bacteroidales bacterium]|nr:M1 family metallopeptidase [Bacteroidales bacterium]